MKKEYFIYISVAALTFAFIIISFLLKLNRQSQKMTARKIKLGAALLTLSSLLNSCSGPQRDTVTCYEVATPDTNYEEIKKDSLTNDVHPLKKDSIGIGPAPKQATHYGAPANQNFPENE
jgi:hypothetical protein